ncbi:MAG: discoidin domain-containing protein [Calditrichaeota bacterium]|nr:discoidin domain-containing protein [Calditrichota bacterium]
MKTVLIIFSLIFFLNTFVIAGDYNLVTRFSYYTRENSADLLLSGDDLDKIKDISYKKFFPGKNIQKHKDCWLIPIDIQNFKTGKHTLEIAIRTTDGVQSLQTELIKLAPKFNEVKVDRLNGGLLVDDLPFFPFGFYTGSPVNDVIREEAYNAMNLVGVYQNNEDSTLAERVKYMDECAAYGIKVNYHLNGLVGSSHNNPGQIISNDEIEHREALLKKEVETFRDHPALLSWYMNDEPIGQGRKPELLQRAYDIIKENDPYHPVSVVFVIPDRAAPFTGALDIAMTDPYPIPGDVNHVSLLMDQLQQNFQYKKALWLVPQAFGGGEFWSREPNAAEIRIMTYLGIIDGAMGIKYFIRRRPHLFPKSRLAWNEATSIAHELSMLLPWLFSGEKSFIKSENENIKTAVWKRQNDALLIVATPENTPGEFSINLPEDLSGYSADVLFENRTIHINNNQLSDYLSAYGVNIYIIKQADTEPAVSHNLFINQGFEKFYSAGLPFGCYAGPKDADALYFLDSRTAHSGNNSLRFTLPDDSSKISLNFYKMQVQNDQLYQCSIWLKAAPGTEKTNLQVTLNELKAAQTFEATQDWTKHTFSFNSGSKINALGLSIAPSGKGTIYVDDIEVTADPLIDVTIKKGPAAKIAIITADTHEKIYYTFNNDTDINNYSKPFEIQEYTTLHVLLKKDEQERKMQYTIPLSKATQKKCTFQTLYSPKYSASGEMSITDGQYGTLAFRDNKWLGWEGTDVEFTVDLEKSLEISKAKIHSLVSINDGIHAAQALDVLVSDDGKNFNEFGSIDNPDKFIHENPNRYLELQVTGSKQKARFVKFKITSPRIIPEGFLFSGTKAWIFIDEILVD